MDEGDRRESNSADIDERDKGCGIVSKEDIKLGTDGALSPKLKMMLEKYGTEKSDEYTDLFQESTPLPSRQTALSSSVAPPPPPPPPPSAMVNGTSRPPLTPDRASVTSEVPPPLSQANETDSPLDSDLANAIAAVRLRRASLTSNENKIISPGSPASLPSPGDMMSDLNKKLLARKKAAEASVVQLPGNRVATTPKFNAKMNEMFGAPVTHSFPFKTTASRHASEPTSTTWKRTSSSDPATSPLDLSVLKEELVQVIHQEVRAAKEDIIKNDVPAAKEEIIKTIREEFQSIKGWIQQEIKRQHHE